MKTLWMRDMSIANVAATSPPKLIPTEQLTGIKGKRVFSSVIWDAISEKEGDLEDIYRLDI